MCNGKDVDIVLSIPAFLFPTINWKQLMHYYNGAKVAFRWLVGSMDGGMLDVD